MEEHLFQVLKDLLTKIDTDDCIFLEQEEVMAKLKLKAATFRKYCNRYQFFKAVGKCGKWMPYQMRIMSLFLARQISEEEAATMLDRGRREIREKNGLVIGKMPQRRQKGKD